MHRAVPTDKDDGGKWTETFKFVSAYGANSRASNANLTTASRTLETTVRYSTGFPSLQYSVNYYRETRFRINLTANNFELVKGKDKPYFLDTESFVYTDKKFTKEVLPSMFTFNKIDYFNYYDRNAKAYITEKIISK